MTEQLEARNVNKGVSEAPAMHVALFFEVLPCAIF